MKLTRSLALLLALAPLANAQGTPQDAWRFQPLYVHETNVLDYYELHVQSPQTAEILDLVLIPQGACQEGGTLTLEVLPESTAIPTRHYNLTTSQSYNADTPSLTFELELLPCDEWFRSVWLWLRIADPNRVPDLSGGTVLIGIRPSAEAPTISFDGDRSTVSVGGSASVPVSLSAACQDDVTLYYQLTKSAGGATMNCSTSGSLVIPAGSTTGAISVDAGSAALYEWMDIELLYENADGSETNQFFGNHSWTHNYADAFEENGLLSFHAPGDPQGFFLGGAADRGFESAAMEQTTLNPVVHFDGSGPVPGVVTAADAIENGSWYSPYVRGGAELQDIGGPSSFVQMKNWQELVVYLSPFVGSDSWRNSNHYSFNIRDRMADVSHVLVVQRSDSDNGGVLAGGSWWKFTNTSHIHVSDQYYITGVDHGDGYGERAVLVFRHFTDPTHDYFPSKPNKGVELPTHDVNPLFTANVGTTPPVYGRGGLFYAVYFRTMWNSPVDPAEGVPTFWSRTGLWEEPRGNARIDAADFLVHRVWVY